MGHLKIKCDSCGSEWIVYHRDIKNRNAKTCPMCGESIDGQTWEKQILPAFGAMEDGNRELFKDHAGYHGTLFTVGYEPDVIYPNAKKSEVDPEEFEALSRTVEHLLSITEKLIGTIFDI